MTNNVVYQRDGCIKKLAPMIWTQLFKKNKGFKSKKMKRPFTLLFDIMILIF